MKLSFETPLPDDVQWVAIEGEPDEVCRHTHGDWLPCSIPKVPPADVLALLGDCPNADSHHMLRGVCPGCMDTGRPVVHIDTPCPRCGGGVGFWRGNAWCDGPCATECDLGTVTRTFTATELLPVEHGYFGHGGEDRVRVYPDGTTTLLSGRIYKSWDLTDVTVHGLSASTTHALHIKAT